VRVWRVGIVADISTWHGGGGPVRPCRRLWIDGGRDSGADAKVDPRRAIPEGVSDRAYRLGCRGACVAVAHWCDPRRDRQLQSDIGSLRWSLLHTCVGPTP